jgi:hypothetical protein
VEIETGRFEFSPGRKVLPEPTMAGRNSAVDLRDDDSTKILMTGRLFDLNRITLTDCSLVGTESPNRPPENESTHAEIGELAA